jgi:hypothetical protein
VNEGDGDSFERVRRANQKNMGTFFKVLAVCLALFGALGGCILFYIAFGELLRRRPMKNRHTRTKLLRSADLWR